MIGFALFYIVATITVILCIGLFIRAKKRNILIAIPVTAIAVPAIILGLLFAFKTPLQRGKILKNTRLGQLLNLIFPPDDLYYPLASINLEPAITKYTFNYSHKYVGSYAVMLSSPRLVSNEKQKYEDISISLTISDDNQNVFEITNDRLGYFWGSNEAYVASYNVPRDLAVSQLLTSQVKIKGDLNNFFKRRGKTTLKIQKISDE